MQELMKYWSESLVFDEDTRKEISDLIKADNQKELSDRFYRDLEFGTGGLRGILGAGSARMNFYNVRKASHALALQVKESFPEIKAAKIALTYDSRKFSREFAVAASEVFAAHGIIALITKELRPVPMLSFLVRDQSCQAGVCITASHNPPNYNGYKVYWNTGGQITPPVDKKIIDKYLSIRRYEDIPLMSFEKALASGLAVEVGTELDDKYFEKVKTLSLNPDLGRKGFKIAYTPLHGTGAYPVRRALECFGFEHIHIVPEQEKPDGSFPTVKSPNPEDSEALKMAVALARKVEADIVLATDPDADRIGIAVREHGDYLFLNGNQIGCLLTDYFLGSLKAHGKLPPNALVIKTIVTTEMERKIAESYNVACEETLTGFKWICGLIEEYESGQRKPYKKYVCGGEESFGFLADSFVRDKDGVSSCAIAAEMVAYYKAKGKSISQVLNELYRKHGVYQESLHTITLPGKDGAERITKMMRELREHPPRQLDGVAVEILRDYKLRQEMSLMGESYKKTSDLTLPVSDVLQFNLKDGTRVSARPSGTEPKIKFYVSVCSPISADITEEKLESVKSQCLERTKRIEEIFVSIAESI